MAEVGKIKGEKVYVCPQCGREYNPKSSSVTHCAICGSMLKLKVQNEHYYENDNAAGSESICYYLVDVITLERYLIPEGRSQIGRKVENSLVPISADLEVISGEHADIIWAKGERPEIIDHSYHGTFVNKRKLVPKEPVELRPGDIICFGDTLQRGDMFCVKLMRIEAVEEDNY